MNDSSEIKPSFKNRLEKKVGINLMPGDLFIAEKPQVIKTLLGSCISVVMHNKRTKVSTISHAQLPNDGTTDMCTTHCPVKCYRNAPDINMFKYVTHSSHYMYKKLEGLGIRPDEIDVKLFGGSNVIDVLSDRKTIGTANIEKAHETLKRLSLRLKVEDTGGKQGRTIYLVSHNGDVFVRKHVKTDLKKELEG